MMRDALNNLTLTAKGLYKNISPVVNDTITPTFVVELRTKIDNKLKLEEADEFCSEIRHIVDETIQEELVYKEENSKQTKKRKKKLKKDKAGDELQTSEKEVARSTEAQATFDDFRERQRKIIEAEQARQRKEEQEESEKVERETKELRTWRQHHWGNEAKKLHEEARALQATNLASQKRLVEASVEETSADWMHREKARASLQVEAPGLSEQTMLPTRSLGIFGTPLDTGSFFAINGGGFVSGIDQYDVPIFDVNPQTDFESEHINLIDKSSELSRNQALYDNLQSYSKRLEQSMDQMCQLRSDAERDLKQVNNELTVMERDQLGPPRRLPLPSEVSNIAMRKEKVNILRSHINDLQHSIDISHERKLNVNAQMLSIAKTLAVLRTETKEMSSDLSGINGGLGNLPVVIGRNITKVDGLDITAKPHETFNAVTQQSKFIVYKDMEKTAQKAHRDGVKLDRKMWVLKQTDTETRDDVERALNRLADISDKLQQAHVGSIKMNLIDAIQGFHRSGLKLKPVVERFSGPLRWWVDHKPDLSSNVEGCVGNSSLGAIVFDDDEDLDLSIIKPPVSESSCDTKASTCSKPKSQKVFPRESAAKNIIQSDLGVTLGPYRSGTCSGVIMLPKTSIWRIFFTISRCQKDSRKVAITLPDASATSTCNSVLGTDDGSSYQQDNEIDSTDSCTVHLGPGLENMHLIGIYKSSQISSAGNLVYDVKYIVRGDCLAFKFDFISSSEDVMKHMMVSVGLFEKYEIKGIEFVEDSSSGRQRVLSSYIKMLRIEESQGKLRITKLLEELIKAEESDEEDWQSDVILGFVQHYRREYFLRVLRAEIILEQKIAEQIFARTAAVQDPSDNDKQLALSMSEESVKRVKASQSEYMVRKRKLELPKIQRAYKDIGRKLDMYDKANDKWRHVFVVNVMVRWIENGVISKILHMLQEFDDYGGKVGEVFQLDLTGVKYFDSPARISDDAAIDRHRENQRVQKALDELDGNLDQSVHQARVDFERFRTNIEESLREATSNRLLDLDSRIDQEAKDQLLLKSNKKKLKYLASQAFEEISCALVTPDPKMKPKDQALSLAKQWFIDKYKMDAKLAAEYENKLAEDDAFDMISRQEKEVESYESSIRKQAESDRDRIKRELQEHILREKEILLRRVKFDRDVFKAVIPKADMCEHTRTKAWGNSYNTGVRCLHCNKELEELYKEESQVLGYGTGSDPVLYEAIKRHRINEASFKFKDSSELIRVEDERLRLEKERRAMELNEQYFYDFSDIQAIYHFDHRHASELKDHGIFRQGLHWTERELEEFNKKAKIREALKLRRQGLLPPPGETFDLLSRMPDPPPTFRAADERHKAQYDDLKHVMGRMHNFKKRIMQLKDQRVDLLVERGVIAAVLQSLHQNAFKLEVDVARLEKDLDNTSKLTYALTRAQTLLQNVTDVQKLAERRKKKAEMRTVGPWEQAKQVQKEYDIAHDETRTLLKHKFTYDLELSVLVDVVKNKEQEVQKTHQKFIEQERVASRLFYTRPGNMVLTKFGLCIVRMYRPIGDTIMVTLNFGEPRAKAWIHVPEVIARDRARQQAELYLMTDEDNLTQAFVIEERDLIRRELSLMRREEVGVKEYYAVLDFAKVEDNSVTANVRNAVTDGYTVMGTWQYRALHRARMKDEMVKRVKQHNDSIKNYIGRRADKPLPLTFSSMITLRRNVNNDLKRKFLEDLAMTAEMKTREDLRAEKDRLVVELVNRLLMESVMTEMIGEIAVEAVREGLEAKRNAEFSSGILFSSPLWMQYGVYCRLRDVWKARKLELKLKIETSMSAMQRLEHNEEKKEISERDVAEELRKKLQHRAEKQRQRTLNEEMAEEEKLCREFYGWELRENLRERRRMREEDQMAKQYAKDLELLQKMQTSKYAVSHFMLKEQEQLVGVSTYERRRLELKALTLERRRIAEEIALMIVEDKRSFELRIIDRAERQRKQLLAELGDQYLEDEENDIHSSEKLDRRNVKIPPWMTVPKNWFDLKVDAQIKYIVMMEKWRNHSLKKASHMVRDGKRVEAMQRKSLETWQLHFDSECNKLWRAELSYMETSEECKLAEHDLHSLQENMTRLTIYCQDKGETELRIKSKLLKKKAIAEKCDRELQEATRWLDACNLKLKERKRLVRTMEKNCRWLDTDSINGYFQRFRTDVLREMLYKFFFTKMIYTIVNRAEIVATERKMMRLQDSLSINRTHLTQKMASLKNLWRDFRRSEFLRMRKSALSEVHHLFPNSRRKILRDCFAGLVRFHLWNRGHREAFELKYEVIKRHVDLERMFKDQLLNSEKSKNVASEKGKMLTMQKHRERPVCCKNCNLFYLEAQNHSMICRFHSGKFAMECPKSCPNPGLTPLCVSHRRRRWSCCDSSQQNAEGCSRKYHVPADSDPIYDKIMEKINDRDASMISTLDSDLEAARKENWEKLRNETMRHQVMAVEDPLADMRVTANKYHSLKFI